MLKKNVT
jgi:hypothetical protein